MGTWLARSTSVLLLLGLGGLGTASATEPAGETVLADLPFEAAGTNRIVIDLATEDAARRLPLLVDTGASHSFMDPGLARQLGVLTRPAKRTAYRRATRLGRDLQFHVDTRASDTSSRVPLGYGVLGGNFLARYVLELDFAQRRVRFLDPERYEVPARTEAADETVVPLVLVAERPHVEIGLGAETLRLLVDTGDPFGLSILREAARKLTVEPVPVDGLVVWGLRGPLRTELGEIERLRIGSLELGPLPVLIHESHYNQGDASGAVLGYDLLSQFQVRIDYPRRRLWLRRDPGARISFYGADYRRLRSTGALLEPVPEEEGAIFVRYVLPDTPAARLGLRPGDWVSPLELRARGLDVEALHRLIEQREKLTVVRQRDGRWVDVSLE